MKPHQQPRQQRPRPDGQVSLYAIGRVAKAFGIRGEVVVELLTSQPSRFSSLKRVLVGRSEGSATERTISSVEFGGKGLRVLLGGVNTRNDAEELVGSFLFVTGDDRIPLSTGTFFVGDLIGMRVVTNEGAEIGTVKEVMKLPAQDVYVVEKSGRQIMIPAVRQFILRVDPAERLMVVQLIEGLQEE